MACDPQRSGVRHAARQPALPTLGGRQAAGFLVAGTAVGGTPATSKASPWTAFYIAVFDADAIDRPGLTAADGGLVRTVYLPEVMRDYTAVVADAGRFGGGRAVSRDHRYGCSGVDGVSLDPPFGMPSGAWQLTVAYGVQADVERSDNDHQVLLQYPVDRLLRFAEVLDEAAPHRSGPPTPGGKFFVRTGITRFGVQNLEYDEWTGRWFLGVYAGAKPRFPNFTLFAVDARARPAFAPLAGLGGNTALSWSWQRTGCSIWRLVCAGGGSGRTSAWNRSGTGFSTSPRLRRSPGCSRATSPSAAGPVTLISRSSRSEHGACTAQRSCASVRRSPARPYSTVEPGGANRCWLNGLRLRRVHALSTHRTAMLAFYGEPGS